MMSERFALLLALALSVTSLLMACLTWWSVFRLRRRSSVRSFRALSELSTEVSDLWSLFKLLQAQQKRFAARTGGRPPKESTDHPESEDPPKDPVRWKKWARAKLAENIRNKRPPYAGIGG